VGEAARLAGRVSGDATVAYAASFARAAEAALGIEPPPRAVHLRALMGEIERIANHIGDFGAICNDAAFALMQAHTSMLRERLLRAADACFGHRLMMDRVIPGGVSTDISPAGSAALHRLLPDFAARLDQLARLYDSTASLLQRTVTTGIVKPEQAARFAAGGPIGRASGRAFDCRVQPGYAPYDRLAFAVPCLTEGDVNARVWIRIEEMRASLGLIEQLLATLPPGPCRPLAGSARGSAPGRRSGPRLRPAPARRARRPAAGPRPRPRGPAPGRWRRAPATRARRRARGRPRRGWRPGRLRCPRDKRRCAGR
jgi:Ni,Fe-hydrogenase III large subunit